MNTMSGFDSVSTFSHIEKIATFKMLKKNQRRDLINFGEFPTLSLESLAVVTSINYVCYLYEENKSGSIVNKLQYS